MSTITTTSLNPLKFFDLLTVTFFELIKWSMKPMKST